MNNFYQARNNNKGLRLKELFEFDEQDKYQMKIAMPEFWLNENSVDLGEIGLLRNDIPSLLIL